MKFIGIIALFLTACCGDVEARYYELQNHRTICIDGVEYIVIEQDGFNKGYGYMSVKFNKNGYVSRCKNEKKSIDTEK